ncbi:TspO and MBR like protein [Pirellula staleyi DSM 6068]|uniref:TspO and MBR like protein n=1 Tax=Pirellula staleyi (strain ATCC 27377 / DSM 6068 / ICPB 4128) TaxID=530564 RepID=D2QY30_PIRSD|nr:TspO/MBR family protein [Pirellula staleyi]ADB18107.1 TspO and MBR like protein [Pirellula staleyi DSM 6068]
MTDRTRWIGLVIFIAICLGAAALGAIATTPEIDGWYRTIAKPSWSPPNWIFGPVWTTLFILMAIAAWLVCCPAGFAAATPLALSAMQLILTSPGASTGPVGRLRCRLSWRRRRGSSVAPRWLGWLLLK